MIVLLSFRNTEMYNFNLFIESFQFCINLVPSVIVEGTLRWEALEIFKFVLAAETMAYKLF